MKLGVYKHWGGKYYRAILLSERDGDRELLVTYIPLYGNGVPATRTVKEFNEDIDRDGYVGPRFCWYHE
jgi:hypothetical protein